jgi:hypothetical protein
MWSWSIRGTITTFAWREWGTDGCRALPEYRSTALPCQQPGMYPHLFEEKLSIPVTSDVPFVFMTWRVLEDPSSPPGILQCVRRGHNSVARLPDSKEENVRVGSQVRQPEWLSPPLATSFLSLTSRRLLHIGWSLMMEVTCSPERSMNLYHMAHLITQAPYCNLYETEIDPGGEYLNSNLLD